VGEKPHLDRQIAQTAASQHGNITRQQVLALGLDRHAIDHRIKIGRLYRAFPGVYCVGRPPVEPLEKAMAAVLACGPRAALSHGSAMTLWGFWKRWDEPFEVTLAGDRRPRGIRTHRSVTLLRRDVVVREGIPVTSAARALLDMAPRIPPRSLTRFVNDGRRREVLALEHLADVAARNRTHPGAPLLMAHAETTQNPTRSGGEDDFQVFCQRYGLPTPLINITLLGYEIDAYFPQEKLIVELDGWPFHRTRDKFESDREQDATMLMHGIATIRITYDRIEDDPDREAARLHRILEDRRRQRSG
jgi:Transcriptional regulator, AbiEi antitoxin/Protein of unknown function (DUF559)